MTVLFDLAYNEFELLVKNHFGGEGLRLDNNQLRIVFEDIQNEVHGEEIFNIYEIIKSVQSETCTPVELVNELLETDLDVAVEWLIESDNYDKSIYITQDDFDNLEDEEQEKNELIILEDASKAVIASIIDESDLEIDFIESVKDWKDIYDFGDDYRYIK